MPSTFLCTFLLTLALRASAHVASPHAFCIFTTHHLQSCDPSTGTPESYLRLNAVLDPESKLAFDVRAERPLSYQNSYKHLAADEEWEIAGVGQGHAVRAGVMRRQQQISMEEASGLKIRLGGGRDEVLFEYGGLSWSESEADGDARCVVGGWDVRDWSCLADGVVNPRERVMTCTFPC